MAAQTSPSHHVLVLGGTAEARALAQALGAAGLPVTFALLSPTGSVEPPGHCRLHVGSFGGEDGLRTFLTHEGITVFINALHPHAVFMQQRAVDVAQTLTIPTFRLQRPLWQALAQDQWQHFTSAADLCAAVARAGHRRLFGAIGPQAMRAFLPLAEHATLYGRRFDPGKGDGEAPVTWIDAAPHPSLEDERGLFKSLAIDALLTKNSGGARPAKLDAAARLGLPVFLLDPPTLSGPSMTQWEDILEAVLALPAPEDSQGL